MKNKRNFHSKLLEKLLQYNTFQIIALFSRSNMNKINLISILIFIILAIFTPLLIINKTNNLIEPFVTATHLLGTDYIGRDLLKLSIMGYHYTFGSALLIAIINIIISLTLALLSTINKNIRSFLILIFQPLYSFPSVILFFTLISLFKINFSITLLAILISTIPYTFFSIIRNIEKLQEKRFIQLMYLDGAGHYTIIKTALLPLMSANIIHLFRRIWTIAMIDIISIGALGLYVDKNEIFEWGVLLNEAWRFSQYAPWMLFIIGFFIIFTLFIMISTLRNIEVAFNK